MWRTRASGLPRMIPWRRLADTKGWSKRRTRDERFLNVVLALTSSWFVVMRKPRVGTQSRERGRDMADSLGGLEQHVTHTLGALEKQMAPLEQDVAALNSCSSSYPS